MPAIRQLPQNADAIRAIIRRYYAVSAFYAFGPLFILAIYPLFLRSRGLGQFEINIVTAAYFLMTFATDVPTGAFADAVGRRESVVAGCGLRAVAFALYLISSHFWQFVIAASIDGLGTTFGNGPIDAWAIDALDRAGIEGPKDAIFSRKFQLGHIVGMCGTLAGAYIAQVNIATPFLVTIFAWMTAGLAAFVLMTHSKGQSKSLSYIGEDIRRRTIDSTRLGFAHRGVRLLSLAGFISASMWFAWGQEWQQYFKLGFNAGIGIVGWVSVAMILTQVAALEVAARLPGAWKARPRFVAAMAATSSAAVIVAGLARGRIWLALAAVLVAMFAEAVAGPMAFAWYNEMIGGENRATLLSFGTTMGTLGGIVGLPLQGWMVDALGTSLTWQLAGLVSGSRAACYLAVSSPDHEAAIGP